MPEAQIHEVPHQLVNQVWPRVEQFIAAALVHAQGDYSVDDIRVFVTGGQWSLLVAVDSDSNIRGAAVISFFNRPRDRVAFVIAIGGKMIVNDMNWQQFEGILHTHGATYLEGAVRDSVAKLFSRFGMQHKYSIVGKSL